MSIPVHRRPYDVFLSHAHADRNLVDRLYELLTEKAGLSIWYDACETSGGDSIRTTLQRGVEQSRGILVVGSQDAIDSNWVEDELSIAQVERNDSRDFRVIPMRLAGSNVDRSMKGLSWIDIPGGELDGNVLFEVLRSFYPGEQTKDPATSRDVYVSASWDSEGEFSGRAVCNSLVDSGFRLIGDAKDQPTFDLNRIKDVISSCGAFVSVIPFRSETEASSQERPYKYFLAEIDLAASLGLPTLIVADPRISRVDGDDGNWLRMETETDTCPPDVERWISELWGLWREPTRPHYIFLALDLDSPVSRRRSNVRQLLERVTGMPTVIGPDIHQPPLQDSIMRKIAEARLVIADITDLTHPPLPEKPPGFNLDVCVEAGIAYYSGTKLQLIARGELRSPPFMLRLNQLSTYVDEMELNALAHGIARQHRRRIIDVEL